MSFKIFMFIAIILFAIYAFVIIKLCVDSVTGGEANGIAESHVHRLKYEVNGEMHRLDRRQVSLEKEIDELKSALNDQGIATGYTTEKKLYYKDRENEQNKM